MAVMRPLMRTIGGAPVVMCRSEAPCSFTSLKIASILAMGGACRDPRARGPGVPGRRLRPGVFGSSAPRLEGKVGGGGRPRGAKVPRLHVALNPRAPRTDNACERSASGGDLPEYVEKLRIAVRICQGGAEPRDGFFSLFPQAQFHDGPETLLERLNARDVVLPFDAPREGGTYMLNRLDLNWVMATASIYQHLVSPPTYFVT